MNRKENTIRQILEGRKAKQLKCWPEASVCRPGQPQHTANCKCAVTSNNGPCMTETGPCTAATNSRCFTNVTR